MKLKLFHQDIWGYLSRVIFYIVIQTSIILVKGVKESPLMICKLHMLSHRVEHFHKIDEFKSYSNLGIERDHDGIPLLSLRTATLDKPKTPFTHALFFGSLGLVAPTYEGIVTPDRYG
jgi:hypothetical protein